jgi:hypothetical protein
MIAGNNKSNIDWHTSAKVSEEKNRRRTQILFEIKKNTTTDVADITKLVRKIYEVF